MELANLTMPYGVHQGKVIVLILYIICEHIIYVCYISCLSKKL